MVDRDVMARRMEFARRLQDRMIRKGWNQTELARRAKDHLPDGARMERDIISNYIRGRALPSVNNLRAICGALGCEPVDLLPPDMVPVGFRSPPHAPLREFKDMGDGNVWLSINQAVPFDVALKIMELLRVGSSASG